MWVKPLTVGVRWPLEISVKLKAKIIKNVANPRGMCLCTWGESLSSNSVMRPLTMGVLTPVDFPQHNIIALTI